MYSASFGLTQDQAKKLAKGKNIRISQEQVKQNTHTVHGFDIATIKKIERARKGNKGTTITLTKEQQGANPLLFALLSAVAPELLDAGITGVSRLVKGKNMLTGKGCVKKKVPLKKRAIGGGLTAPHAQPGHGMYMPGMKPNRRKRGAGIIVPGRGLTLP
jgi:ribosomal protein S4